MVVVSSVRLPDNMDWYTRFAEHAWIDLKQGEEGWTRIEITGTWSGVDVSHPQETTVRETHRWDNRATVLALYRGEEAEHLIPQILQAAEEVRDFGRQEITMRENGTWTGKFHAPDDGRLYDAWPGPNSNTLIAQILDAVPGFAAELHHNSVGKDYPDGFRAGSTSSGCGFEADFGLLGAGLGWKQGVELHVAGLTAGLSLWPPALKIPLLPRIGVPAGLASDW